MMVTHIQKLILLGASAEAMIGAVVLITRELVSGPFLGTYLPSSSRRVEYLDRLG